MSDLSAGANPNPGGGSGSTGVAGAGQQTQPRPPAAPKQPPAGAASGVAPFALGSQGYEYAEHVNKEPHGPTYDMVMSDISGDIKDPQDPHYLGGLLPPARPRSEEVRSFFDATNVMG